LDSIQTCFRYNIQCDRPSVTLQRAIYSLVRSNHVQVRNSNLQEQAMWLVRNHTAQFVVGHGFATARLNNVSLFVSTHFHPQKFAFEEFVYAV
jgi:hypothetical protein